MTEPWSKDWRRGELKNLFQDWRDCTRCELAKHRKNVVFGNGNPEAEMLFVGQAPGETEDETGEPFSGPSGELFDAILEAAGIERKSVFTTNLVMCMPPKNADGSTRIPTKEEREACFDRLYRQIYVVDPWLIVPVGKEAMKALMKGDSKSIEAEHGKLGQVRLPGWQKFDNGACVEVVYDAMPIFHTAYIMREDVIDPRTKAWSEKGPAIKTIRDLTKARKIVELMKKQYEKAQEALL